MNDVDTINIAFVIDRETHRLLREWAKREKRAAGNQASIVLTDAVRAWAESRDTQNSNRREPEAVAA